MKLNPDCIRAVLLAVEEVCDMENFFSSIDDIEQVKGDFSENEILYHARQCDLAGMFYNYRADIEGNFSVTDLSPKGHEFLANIREDTIWNNVKAVSAKVGSKSLNALAQIATSVISEIIKAQLGLPPTQQP